MQGYKVFNQDFTCLDFKFEVGKTYEHDGEVIFCKSGFHFCEKLSDCFFYYSFNPENIVCEVECEGVSEDKEENCSKRVCKKITILRQLTWQEVLDKVNTGKGNSGRHNSGNKNSGNWNSGHRNSGNYNSGNNNSGNNNSGNCNSGDWNSGNCNSGYHNSGYYNSGYRNSGNRNSGNYNSGNYNACSFSSDYFCTEKSKPRLFNKVVEGKTHEEVRSLLPYIHLVLQEDIDGKIQTYTYKQAWKNGWEKLNKNERNVFLSLPNFDKDIFFEITGVEV